MVDALEIPRWVWWLTHFGNSVLLLSAAGILALWAALGAAWRTAAMGLALLGLAVLIVLASKVAFFGWGYGLAAIDFTGFSGHAMLSAAVLPPVALALVSRRSQRTRQVAVWLSGALAVAVAWSRLELNAHSLSEVILGAGIGAAVSVGAIRYGLLHALPRLSALPLALTLGVLLAATAPRGNDNEGPRTHGLVLKISLWASGRAEPYTRAMMHQAAQRPQNVTPSSAK
jgi:hypothetical protein